MPNIDGGHYFLTVLAPVKTDVIPLSSSTGRSYEQLLRQTLAQIPTAQQTKISAQGGLNSPFSRNNRTHFARFSIIENLTFNGRNTTDPIVGSITSKNPLEPQHVDSLSCPYLLFAADFDAPTGKEDELDSYLEELWLCMENELREIFKHCVGFEDVTSSVAFISYIKKCQLETTMPFNDYWRESPPLTAYPIKPMLIGSVIIGFSAPWVIDLFINSLHWSAGFKIGIGVILLILGIFITYLGVMKKGGAAFPKAPDSDLKTILKALYLQQKFSDFAIQNQGANAATVKTNFEKFLKTNQPENLGQQTQSPGVISYNYGEKS